MYKKNLAIWNEKTQKFSEEKIHILIRAMGKIRETIYLVYEDKTILDEITKIRKKFNIPDNFFVTYKVEHSSDHIANLLTRSLMKWKKEVKGAKLDKKLGDQIYKNNNLEAYNPKYINDRLWSFIIWAKLFEIPKKILLGCITNLVDYHFPKVNHALQIQAYPSTTEEEFKFIWDDIQNIQKIYIKDLDKRGKFEYPNHDRDIRAGEIKKEHPAFTNEQIQEQLIEEKLTYKGAFEASCIPAMIKNPGERVKKLIKKRQDISPDSSTTNIS